MPGWIEEGGLQFLGEEINGGGFVILGLKETMILFQYGMQFHFYSVYAILFHCPVFFFHGKLFIPEIEDK